MASLADVRRIATSLPGVEQRSGESGYRVAGKLFTWTWMERVDPKRPRVANAEVLVVRVASELEKEALLSVEGDRFFTEPHYDGYAAVLVRLAAIDAVDLADLITDAWRTKAPKRLLAELEGEGRPGVAGC
jgi:hypothetical protein